MRHIIYLLLIGIGLTAFKTSNLISDFEIVGKWKSEDETGIGYFTFEENGYAFIESKQITIGGEKFERDGMKFSLQYKVDYDKKPFQMDLIFTELDKGNQMVWPCIFKIIDQNKIIFARGNRDERPADFIGSDYTILERIK